MKKSSILLSIATAALSLPALSKQNVTANPDPTPPLEKKSISNLIEKKLAHCNNKELTHYKKELEQCQEALVFNAVSQPTQSNTNAANKKVEEALTLEVESTDDTNDAELTLEGDVSDDLSLSIEGDTETTSDTAKGDETDTTEATKNGYDPSSVFGLESNITLRKLKPVKQLLIDLMYGYTKVNQNNQQYNFYANTPAPFIKSNTFAAAFDVPLTEKMDMNVFIENDSVTSASPLFYTVSGASPSGAGDPTPQASDEILQGVTGASIYDQRAAGSASFNYYGEKHTTTLQAGTSKERDYTSHNVSANTSISLSETNTSINVGANFVKNDIRANQLGANFATRVNGTNQGVELLGGFTQIINPTLISQFAVTYHHAQGYLNDVYKPDSFPDNKTGMSYAFKFLKYLADFHEGSIGLDYRYYTDDWGIKSHTINSSLRVAFAHGWAIEPGIRYYSQNRSKFYNLFIPTDRSNFYTSDYRYASYGQVVGSLEVNKQMTADVTVYSGIRYGVANADLHLGGKDVTWHSEDRFTAYKLWGVYVGLKSLY